MERTVLFGVGALLFASCARDQQVGIECNNDSDCEGELSCYTALADGYCTRECELGESCFDSPGNVASYCADNGGDYLCSVVCQNQDDCRDGYSCENAPGTNNPAAGPLPTPDKVCVAL